MTSYTSGSQRILQPHENDTYLDVVGVQSAKYRFRINSGEYPTVQKLLSRN